MNKTIKKVIKDMNDLVLFRGTKKEIVNKLNTIGTIKTDVILCPFPHPLPDNDFGFAVMLGKINDEWLDFDIYMLPTNKKDVFIITETVIH